MCRIAHFGAILACLCLFATALAGAVPSIVVFRLPGDSPLATVVNGASTRALLVACEKYRRVLRDRAI